MIMMVVLRRKGWFMFGIGCCLVLFSILRSVVYYLFRIEV